MNMRNDRPSQIEKVIKERTKRKWWQRAVSILSAVAVFCTTYAMILPAITWERSLLCEIPAHRHNESCYEMKIVPGEKELVCLETEHEHGPECYIITDNLICGLEECEGHTHGEGCFDEAGVLICTLEESEGHSHSEACYEKELDCQIPEHVHSEDCWAEGEPHEKKVLVCQLEEHEHSAACFDAPPAEDDGYYCGQIEHTHSEEQYCYFSDGSLWCTIPEHVHTLVCKSNPNADVESEAKWCSTFANVSLTGNWAEDAIAIAKTQLGYTESTRNYEVQEDGTTIKGYTRYGDWYGNAYGDWCAMFCSFCLHYAGVDRSLMPLASGCEAWVSSLTEKGLYHEQTSEYLPKSGDLVFFNNDDDPYADHVGFVFEVHEDGLTTIEGNWGDCVCTVERRFADGQITGYGELPEIPAMTVDVLQPETIETEITIESEPASDGAVAVVNGYIPEGAVVEIEAVALSDEQLIGFFGEEKAASMSGYVAYDITILVNGEEWQPDESVSVVIKHPDIQVSGNQTLEVAHVDSVTNEVSVVNSELDENGDISITAEGFSYYIVYTVDFHYGELIYSLDGGDSVLLSDLFAYLDIEDDVETITDIHISAPDLFEVKPVGSDWQLISLASFDTEETLYITFDNGTTISIKLTDPPGDPFEPGLIKIKLNLFDWDTGDPLPYVTMGINRQSNPPLGTARGIITLTSDKDGIAYAEIPYTTIGTKTYINGNVEIFDSAHPASDYTRFDMDAITVHYDYDISVSGRIRNSVRALHAGAVPKTAGLSAYDDFYFNSGMPANGAYVEFNVYLKDANSGTHTISFDTSTIANASAFTPISIGHGQSVNTAGITIPAATNSGLSTLPLLGWTCNGVDFDPASPINHNIVLTPKWASMCTVSFDTSKVSNPSDYPAQHIMGSGYVVEPSVAPVNSSDSSRAFLHWSLNGEPFDFANTPITEDIILKPIWEAEGIIHFKIYMWDHEYYVNHGTTGSGDHRADGQTKIPIDGVRMVVKTYPGSDGGSEGTPAAADWNSSWNGMIEDYRKSPLGRPGGPGAPLEGVVVNYNSTTGLFEGDYVITADQLQYLTPGYVIDTDPDCGVIAQYNRAVTDPNYITGPGIGYHNYTGPSTFGDELTVFDWDWYVAGEDTAGAGNTGVRVIPECKRRGGTITNGTNLNDVAQISQEMIDDGFEFTFVCYVVPAVVVQFDSNGGQPSYPMQKFKPVNSIPIAQQEFKATNPGSPVKDALTVFAGWYEVIGKDENGNDILDTTPWDFNRVVTHSMTLKAVYTDRLYTVLWKNETGTQVLETDHYRFGDIPYYDGTIPTKASTSQYDYEFAGWELVDPAGDTTVYPGRTGTSVQSDQVYEARFTPKAHEYTVKWVDWNWDPDDETGLIEKDENVPYGDTAHFDGNEPSRASTAEWVYTFIGWKKIAPEEGSVFTGRNGEVVHGDQIYQAQYSKTYTCKSLTIEKNVIGVTTSEIFSFELEVINSDDTVPDFSLVTLLPSGVTLKPGTTNVLCFNLGDNESISIEDILPTNGKMTLSETGHAGYNVTMDTELMHYSGDSNDFVLSRDMTVTVNNSIGAELPSTGGIGVYPIYALGTLLLAGPIMYGCILRRRRERRAE